MEPYYFLKDNNFWEKIPTKPGVYRLIAIDIEFNRPQLISRVCGNDEEGVLYIGESYQLRNRLGDLKKSILEKYTSDSHPAGQQYKSNTKLMNKFTEEALVISIVEIDDHESEEKRLLNEYRTKFGELPPLNQKV